MESICFFNKFKSWGGGEKWHYEAANFFQKNGYKISVICHRKGELLKRIKKIKIFLFLKPQEENTRI